MTVLVENKSDRPSAVCQFRIHAHTRAAETTRRFWYSIRRCWWHSYWDLEVTGLKNVPKNGPVLLCGNHTSHLDAIAILAALPRATALRVSTAAASDVFAERPARNAVSRLTTNALPIRRGAEFAAGLRTLETVLLDRRPLLLFPEGRRSPDGAMVEFKSGAAMLAVRTGVPIIPIRLEGLHESLGRGRHVPMPARVNVQFGSPISPEPYRRAIADGRLTRRAAYQQLTDEVKSAIARMQDAAQAAAVSKRAGRLAG